ncbi:MAG: glycosyltransferase family 39 protein [Actinomycetota bacterium]|nr:glycosyltransferase family 39 protein [Actinomycetota bacterium]
MDLTFRGAEYVRPEEDRDDAAFAVSVTPPLPAPALGRGWRGLLITVLAVGTVLRFLSFSHLWLDEALSVNIARLPLGDIPDALRHDGAPPFYYVLLHAWMRVFGEGTFAVRALSAVFGVTALPLMWLAARRVAGPRAAWAALILLAASPFGIRYSTEARMYSLMVVLVLVAFLATSRLLEGGGRRPQLVLAVATGLTLLTHYWALYLLVATVAALGHVAYHGSEPGRGGARRALLAIGAGCLLFLPWVPSFLHQLAHTGAPWGRAAGFRTAFDAVTEFAGGYWNPGIPLGLLYFGLIVLAVLGWGVDRRRIVLELRPRALAAALAAVAFGTLVLGVVASKVTGSAFASRYAAIFFPLVLLLVALGTEVFVHPGVFRALLAIAVVLGLWASYPNVVRERTSAAAVASAIEEDAVPGDVVVYCPDQLGPSVSRELDAPGVVQLTFPRAAHPALVDWVDYRDTVDLARPFDFAQTALAAAGSNDIWVVWAPAYRTFGIKCQRMMEWLNEVRPGNRMLVRVSTKYFERPGLVRYRAAPRPAG